MIIFDKWITLASDIPFGNPNTDVHLHMQPMRSALLDGWSLIRLGLWCLTPLSTIFSLHRGGRIYGSRKPPTHRQSLTNFSVTNNLIHNIVMIPDIVLKFLTFDTDGQHSTWRYDKKNDCNLPIRVITKLPNSEQSYKGKVKTHKYINRKNQSTTTFSAK